ncbi:MAG: ABC transporter permease [Acetivibrio ethanolgignens]
MKKIGNFLVGFLLLQLIWLLGALLLHTRALPNPLFVYLNFPRVLEAGIFLHVGASLLRITAGILISLLLGIPLGLFMAYQKNGCRFLNPLVYFAYPIPKTALLPVVMLLLGLGNASKIVILVLTVVFQVMIGTKDAALGIDESFYQVAQSCNASARDMFFHITLPAILPSLFTGLRINVGTSLAVLLLVEAYGTRLGIGYYILDAWSRISYLEMYGGILVISLMGALLFLILELLETRVVRR